MSAAYLPMNPTAVVTYTRPDVEELADGTERTGAPTPILVSSPGIQEATSEVQHLNIGRNVHFAAWLFEPDTTTELREGDAVSFTWRGKQRDLRIFRIEGPFHATTDPDPDHREILATKTTKRAG